MLNFILRKTYLKSYTREEQDVCLLQRAHIVTYYLLKFMMLVMVILPGIIVIGRCIEGLIRKNTNIVFMIFGAIVILYTILCALLIKTKAEKICEFRQMIFSKIIFYLFTLKGKAISNLDWHTIKELDKKCYDHIMKQECKGYCYNACFRILQCLKKGNMKFIAVLNPDRRPRYTMHVLYVNNDWCFDTYSQRQYPLKKIMSICKAIEYKEFSYSDIEGKTYYEFREENCLELKEWCRKNNIEQNW